MSVCKDKFWIDNYTDLFCDIDPIPVPSMNLNKQLNALTRLIFFITLLLAPFGGTQTIFFLIFGIIFVIILFYSLRNMNCKENYKSCSLNKTPVNIENNNNYTVEFYKPQCTKISKKCTKNTTNPFRIPARYNKLNYGPNFVSENQALVGKPAKRTLIPPISVPPAFSSNWKENSFVVRPGINSQTNQFINRELLNIPAY